MAESVLTRSILEGLRRDAVHAEDIANALLDLRRRFQEVGVPFAVIGALAMRQFGYARFTEDIDIVTTRDGLDRIHAHLVGRGLVARAPGLRKKLRHTGYNVNIDVLQAGEHAGDSTSPVVYPNPDSPDFVDAPDRVRYATLPALVRFKLASGIWGKRPRDLADVQELIKANRLDAAWSTSLPVELCETFLRLVNAASEEKDIEEP